MTREELYQLVWSQPMTEVAKSLGVSGSYMARVCTHLSIPRPNLGYWAKHAVGKATPRPPLPAARPGDQLSWSKGETLPFSPEPRPARGRPHQPEQPLGKGMHALLRGAKFHFENSRPVKENEHLRPKKRLLVDITATKLGLDKAILLANDLFMALEKAGHRVTLSSLSHARRPQTNVEEKNTKQTLERWEWNRFWRPQNETVVYVNGTAIGLAIVEMTEGVLMRYVRGKYIRDSEYVEPKRSRGYIDHTWTTTEQQPTKRYRIVAYSTKYLVNYMMSWQDKPGERVVIKDIVKDLELFAREFSIRLEEAEKREEIERQKREAAEELRRRENDKQRIAQSISDSRDGLTKVMQQWAYTLSVEEFFRGVEKRAKSPEVPEARRQKILTRLRMAREFLGTQDPVDFLMSWRTPLERYQPKYPE